MQTFFMHIEGLLYRGGRPCPPNRDERLEINELENADGKCDAGDAAQRSKEPEFTNREAAEVR
jgi:hypothetical protein